MQSKNRWMLQHDIKNRIVLPIAAACLLFSATSILSGETPQKVYAENQNPYAIPSDAITTEASFESSFEQKNAETYTDAAVISASTSVASDFDEIEKPAQTAMSYSPTITKLNAFHGVCNGPSGKETYYNLPMEGVIKIMRKNGYDEQTYPYWVREDGVKMFGNYIMAAANLSTRPKGTIIECSLGTAIVVDTGTFAYTNPTQLDIAVIW